MMNLLRCITCISLILTSLDGFSSDKDFIDSMSNALPCSIISFLDSYDTISHNDIVLKKLTRTEKKHTTKKQKNEHNKLLENKNNQDVLDWYQHNLRFINPDTQRPYSYVGLVALAILSGPVMMIEPVSRPSNFFEMIRPKDVYSFQRYVKQHQLSESDVVIKSGKMLIRKSVDKNSSHR